MFSSIGIDMWLYMILLFFFINPYLSPLGSTIPCCFSPYSGHISSLAIVIAPIGIFDISNEPAIPIFMTPVRLCFNIALSKNMAELIGPIPHT